MAKTRTSRAGMAYLPTRLLEKKTVVTEACLWLIKHNTQADEVGLKLGRYKFTPGKQPEVGDPKSELTLEPNELDALLKFLSENLQPFHAGQSQWLTVGDGVSQQHVEQLRTFFASPDTTQLLEILTQNDVLPEELLRGLQYQRRERATDELESMLDDDLLEHKWQTWFEENDWVLGTEFVRILDERHIDVDNIADYLMQGYDGFLDLVEIKRPEGGLQFWAKAKDHGNYVPHSDLTKAITQASRYIYEVEREANSAKFIERVGGVKTIKPRCVLIYGRSDSWDDGQREAYRILNASYFNLTILTYDHVLARARRILDLSNEATSPASPGAIEAMKAPDLNDVPF